MIMSTKEEFLTEMDSRTILALALAANMSKMSMITNTKEEFPAETGNITTLVLASVVNMNKFSKSNGHDE
ncbi:hypothetical protein K7432_016438 [Basidiobolus ranarum]|uniref:Uncharacterized protein n=1 Tax=Basidiobolus ranarum TaxID=34480 RepID=A0ABR2WEP6_9FUNG